jgi:hypothetical protein
MEMASRPKVSLVSCAGADEGNCAQALARLAASWPLVELGIQMSKRRGGSSEYPSLSWIDAFAQETMRMAKTTGVLACNALHLNGEWCRLLCKGSIPREVAGFLDLEVTERPVFSRLQLNFDADGDGVHDVTSLARCIASLKSRGISTVLQAKPENMKLIAQLADSDFDVLFDCSGGLGRRPLQWPDALAGRFNAWAGGLGPNTAAEDIASIALKASASGMTEFGIDAQRGLRTPGTASRFEPERAQAFMSAAQAWNTRLSG